MLSCAALATAAFAQAAAFDELFPPQTPDIEITSFAARAQRYFAEADINVIALAAHPDRPDDAIAALLQQYRRQLLRGRMELARARALRQPIGPALVSLERFTAEHMATLRALLPRLSPASQSAVRHTLYTVTQLHQSAQASLSHPAKAPRTLVRTQQPFAAPSAPERPHPSTPAMKVQEFPLRVATSAEAPPVGIAPPPDGVGHQGP